jgi:hypothetical protein
MTQKSPSLKLFPGQGREKTYPHVLPVSEQIASGNEMGNTKKLFLRLFEVVTAGQEHQNPGEPYPNAQRAEDNSLFFPFPGLSIC